MIDWKFEAGYLELISEFGFVCNGRLFCGLSGRLVISKVIFGNILILKGWVFEVFFGKNFAKFDVNPHSCFSYHEQVHVSRNCLSQSMNFLDFEVLVNKLVVVFVVFYHFLLQSRLSKFQNILQILVL
jgi:hypothetical protein